MWVFNSWGNAFEIATALYMFVVWCCYVLQLAWKLRFMVGGKPPHPPSFSSLYSLSLLIVISIWACKALTHTRWATQHCQLCVCLCVCVCVCVCCVCVLKPVGECSYNSEGSDTGVPEYPIVSIVVLL